MKIKETTERECCQRVDLLPYRPDVPNTDGKFFCKHCGRHWIEKRVLDPAGARDTILVPQNWWGIESEGCVFKNINTS